MNHYGNWLVCLTETAAFQMSPLELMSSSLPGKSCFVVSCDWRGSMTSIAVHEVNGVRAALPLLSRGGVWEESFLFTSLGVQCCGHGKSVQVLPALSCLLCNIWECLKTSLGREAAQVCPAVMWKGFSCANCVDLNLHSCWHTKAYVAGSFLSSHRSPKVWLISCKPHALISSSSV